MCMIYYSPEMTQLESFIFRCGNSEMICVETVEVQSGEKKKM